MKIINVFKTHFDIGYTDLSSNVIKLYGGKMLKDVLNICELTSNLEKNKRFVWTMAAWPMMKALELCDEKDRIRAEKLIKNGQIVIHALPFTFHTESLGKSDLLHIFDSADEFCKKYNKPFPVSAKMTDVPGHTIALVSALCKKGVSFLHLGCNPASIPPKVPLLFFWEDKDGNRILTFYNSTYGSNVLPPKNWKFPVWLSLFQTNDNTGVPDISVLDEIQDTINKEYSNADFEVGTLDDFYNEIKKYDLSSVPVIKLDLGDTWIHGIGSYPKEVSIIRRARNIVGQVELNEVEKKKFYENSLLFSEHTWGMDVKTYLTWQRSYDKKSFLEERKTSRYKLIEQSWDEQRERAIECSIIAQKYSCIINKFEAGVDESKKYKIICKNNIPYIINKISGRILSVSYEYGIIGQNQVTSFLRKYLTRFYSWAISDFGRDSYGETKKRRFKYKLLKYYIENGISNFIYATDDESYVEYGNAKKIHIYLTIINDRINMRVELNAKQATPYIEYGNLRISTNAEGKKYLVKKINYELDISKDIAINANNVLFAVSDKCQIDDVSINPIDSPLVSFGNGAIFKFNGGTFKKPKKPDFVFNLFNNMWGTNFPQWIEGNLLFDYIIDD